MKTITPLVFAATIGFTAIADAAFVIEPNGKASANFSAGTATSNSTTAGSGTLGAPYLTPGAASVFGGEAYTYTYTPGTDGDNTVVGATSLNSFAGLSASGLTAGTAGIYNVYHAYPDATNQGGQPTIYDLAVNDISVVNFSQDQNFRDPANGINIGLWQLLGQVTLADVSDTLIVTIDTSSAGGFVGARTAGVFVDYVGPAVPEPSTFALIGFAGLALLRRRR